MTLKEFESYMDVIKKHQAEIDAATKALEIFAPSSYIYVEIGDQLLSAYIKLLGQNVGDDNDWIEWFIEENDWGRKAFEVSWENEERVIRKVEDLYNLIQWKQYEC